MIRNNGFLSINGNLETLRASILEENLQLGATLLIAEPERILDRMWIISLKSPSLHCEMCISFLNFYLNASEHCENLNSIIAIKS